MGFFSLFEKKELLVKISREDIDFFKRKAEEKIYAERWAGRRKDVKIGNFVNCWITEEAFKKVLAERNIWFRYRGLYVGDAEGSVKDFEVKIGGEVTSIGIRSINEDSLKKWKRVAYPDDRFREERDKIADFIIACYNKNGLVRFLGMIGKEKLLEELGNSRRLYSKINQEYFRAVELDKFSFEGMMGLLEKVE